MAKENKKVEECSVEGALKSIENRRAFVKKAMKPADDAVKELEKATTTDKVRLQGTKETKAPKLKPYTEQFVNVKDRKELGALIESAKKEHRPWKVERSLKEGFRYTFFTKVLTEEISEDDLLITSDEEENAEKLEIEDKDEVEIETGEEELTPCDVWKNHLDIEINKDDHSASMCVKGCDDKDKCCIIVKDLTDEELEVLCGAFGCEEIEEPEEVVEIEDEIEVEESLKEDKSVNINIQGDMNVSTGDVEFEKKKEKHYSGHEEHFEEEPLEEEIEISKDDYDKLFKGSTFNGKSTFGDKLKIENGKYFWIGNKESLDAAHEYLKPLNDSLEEASTAMKNAFKKGGQDYTDLLVGRTIARIKDKKAREAAIASLKANRPDVVSKFTGDRKEIQADASIQKKMQQISNASVNESLTEDVDYYKDADLSKYADKLEELEKTLKEKEAKGKQVAENDFANNPKDKTRYNKAKEFIKNRDEKIKKVVKENDLSKAKFGVGVKPKEEVAFIVKQIECNYAISESYIKTWNELVEKSKTKEEPHQEDEKQCSVVHFEDEKLNLNYETVDVAKHIKDLTIDFQGSREECEDWIEKIEKEEEAEHGDYSDLFNYFVVDTEDIEEGHENESIDESLTEDANVLNEEEAIVSDDIEIKLDDLQYFKPAAGARDTWNVIVEQGKVEELAKLLGDFAKEGKMTTTDLNDILWFEKDWIFDRLGIKPGIKSGDDVIDAEVIDSEEEQ